ncbi:uncharacterized protein LOC134181179 [Corticium candelabrum]|uniref:uncharacterized protein LOC134181179 n=1 Tax=Corticium candelabrum TaxID=121492 RepID=UPI002E269085|nr:uncharacterized protein LOC134181179 [Corticium candelabrum]
MLRSGLSRVLQPLRLAARRMCDDVEAAPREFYINKVQLLGRVVSDLRTYGRADNPALAFTMVTRRQIHRKDRETGEKAMFLKAEYTQIIVYGGPLQVLVQQVVKNGSRVLVSGRLQTAITAVPGSDPKRYRTSVVGSSVLPVSEVDSVEMPELRDDIEGSEDFISFDDEPHT